MHPWPDRTHRSCSHCRRYSRLGDCCIAPSRHRTDLECNGPDRRSLSRCPGSRGTHRGRGCRCRLKCRDSGPRKGFLTPRGSRYIVRNRCRSRTWCRDCHRRTGCRAAESAPHIRSLLHEGRGRRLTPCRSCRRRRPPRRADWHGCTPPGFRGTGCTNRRCTDCGHRNRAGRAGMSPWWCRTNPRCRNWNPYNPGKTFRPQKTGAVPPT
jgi:hypothetical protein